MAKNAERITLAEAARRSGHAATTLRQAAQRGALRVERVGEGRRSTLFVSVDDLAAYLAQRRTWRAYQGGKANKTHSEEAGSKDKAEGDR